MTMYGVVHANKGVKWPKLVYTQAWRVTTGDTHIVAGIIEAQIADFREEHPKAHAAYIICDDNGQKSLYQTLTL